MLVGFMQEQAYYRWSINASFLLVGLNTTLVGGRDGYPTEDARREEMDHPLRREGGTPQFSEFTITSKENNHFI